MPNAAEPMAIYELMLASAPSDADLAAAVAAAFDADPKRVRMLGEYAGGDEGRLVDPITLDRKTLTGDFKMSVLIAIGVKTTLAQVADRIAANLGAAVLYEARGGYQLVEPGGASRSVRLAETEDSGEVRLAA